MARVNGMQAPFDILQIISWVYSFGLFVAFYTLYIPFLAVEHRLWCGVVYSFLLVVVVVSAGKCCTIDPRDPGSQGAEPSSATCRATKQFYCWLCRTHVRRRSRHCKLCQKCVDCFDHHCRWLNTCIGARNYGYFCMAICSTAVLLLLQIVIGAVLVHATSANNETIHDGLDWSGLSKGTYKALTALIIALSGLAFLPTLQLVFFHTSLVRVGGTTYDYVMNSPDEQNGWENCADISGCACAYAKARSAADMDDRGSLRTTARAEWCWNTWIIRVLCCLPRADVTEEGSGSDVEEKKLSAACEEPIHIPEGPAAATKQHGAEKKGAHVLPLNLPAHGNQAARQSGSNGAIRVTESAEKNSLSCLQAPKPSETPQLLDVSDSEVSHSALGSPQHPKRPPRRLSDPYTQNPDTLSPTKSNSAGATPPNSHAITPTAATSTIVPLFKKSYNTLVSQSGVSPKTRQQPHPTDVPSKTYTWASTVTNSHLTYSSSDDDGGRVGSESDDAIGCFGRRHKRQRKGRARATVTLEAPLSPTSLPQVTGTEHVRSQAHVTTSTWTAPAIPSPAFPTADGDPHEHYQSCDNHTDPRHNYSQLHHPGSRSLPGSDRQSRSRATGTIPAPGGISEITATEGSGQHSVRSLNQGNGAGSSVRRLPVLAGESGRGSGDDEACNACDGGSSLAHAGDAENNDGCGRRSASGSESGMDGDGDGDGGTSDSRRQASERGGRGRASESGRRRANECGGSGENDDSGDSRGSCRRYRSSFSNSVVCNGKVEVESESKCGGSTDHTADVGRQTSFTEEALRSSSTSSAGAASAKSVAPEGPSTPLDVGVEAVRHSRRRTRPGSGGPASLPKPNAPGASNIGLNSNTGLSRSIPSAATDAKEDQNALSLLRDAPLDDSTFSSPAHKGGMKAADVLAPGVVRTPSPPGQIRSPDGAGNTGGHHSANSSAPGSQRPSRPSSAVRLPPLAQDAVPHSHLPSFHMDPSGAGAGAGAVAGSGMSEPPRHRHSLKSRHKVKHARAGRSRPQSAHEATVSVPRTPESEAISNDVNPSTAEERLSDSSRGKCSRRGSARNSAAGVNKNGGDGDHNSGGVGGGGDFGGGGSACGSSVDQ